MSNEEIRKLLGGYATNTLTESERAALFEAALDDQELFNALQEEEALKSLLADPGARAEVRQALDGAASGNGRPAWSLRWWAWGGAASAVAVGAIVFAVVQANRPLSQPNLQIASTEQPGGRTSTEPAPSRAAESQKPQVVEEHRAADQVTTLQEKKTAVEQAQASGATVETRDSIVSNAPPVPAAAPPAPAAAPPVIPAPVRAKAVEEARLEQSPQGGQVQGQISASGSASAFRQTPAKARTLGAVSGVAAGNVTGPLLGYSLLRQDTNGLETPVASGADLKIGDAIRLRVSPAAPGYLVLYRMDAGGGSNPIASLAVQANTSYTVPSEPIRITSQPEKLRLTLNRGAAQLEADTRARAKVAEQAPAPFVVEITLAGR